MNEPRIVGIKDRIFPEIRQHVQTSGRHSFVGPAVQQFKGQLIDYPLVSGGKLPELQALITPDPGYCWVGHDWSNVETWLLGVLAGDPLILEAKEKGWDTHTLNFCDGTGTPYPPLLTKALHVSPLCASWRHELAWQGDDDQRRTFFKRFIYRLHYRGKPEHAGDIPGAKGLGFNVPRLVETSERYLAKHPAIVEFWRRIEDQADRHRVVYTFMGRPRRLTSEYRNARNREASNHPLQGGVADIYITTALLVKRAAPWARFVYGAHDSMNWSVAVERREEFKALYKPIVQREFDINGMAVSFPASFKEREAA